MCAKEACARWCLRLLIWKGRVFLLNCVFAALWDWCGVLSRHSFPTTVSPAEPPPVPGLDSTIRWFTLRESSIFGSEHSLMMCLLWKVKTATGPGCKAFRRKGALSSKNTFVQKRVHPMTLSSKTVSSLEKRFRPMTFSSQTIFIQPQTPEHLNNLDT